MSGRPNLLAVAWFMLAALFFTAAEQPRGGPGAVAVAGVEDGAWESGDAPLLLAREAAERLAEPNRTKGPKPVLAAAAEALPAPVANARREEPLPLLDPPAHRPCAPPSTGPPCA